MLVLSSCVWTFTFPCSASFSCSTSALLIAALAQNTATPSHSCPATAIWLILLRFLVLLHFLILLLVCYLLKDLPIEWSNVSIVILCLDVYVSLFTFIFLFYFCIVNCCISTKYCYTFTFLSCNSYLAYLTSFSCSASFSNSASCVLLAEGSPNRAAAMLVLSSCVWTFTFPCSASFSCSTSALLIAALAQNTATPSHSCPATAIWLILASFSCSASFSNSASCVF